MRQRVSLDLPESVMERARETAERSGRPVEDVLTEWLEWAGAWSDKSVDIYTPLIDEGGEIARGLREMLRVGSDLKKDQKG